MNRTTFLSRLTAGVLLGLALLTVGACGATKAQRQLASSTTEKLEALVLARDAAQQEALRGLVVHALERFNQLQNSKIDEREARVREHIWTLTDARIAATRKAALDELESVIDPFVEETKKNLLKARADAAGTGDRTKELEYASQLGALLSEHGRQSLSLSRRVESGFAKVRSDQLAAAEKAFAAVREQKELFMDVDSRANEILKTLEEGTKEYRDLVTSGTSELERFAKEGGDGFRFLARGLLGDSAGNRLADLASARTEALSNKLLQKLEKTANEQQTETAKKLDEKSAEKPSTGTDD